MSQVQPLNIPRSALQSAVQFSAGALAGSVVEMIMGKVQEDTPTSQLMLEIGLQTALLGVVSAVSDRTWMSRIDPNGDAGGGMYFFGFVSASPELKAKIEVVAARARVFGRNAMGAMEAEDIKKNDTTDTSFNTGPAV